VLYVAPYAVGAVGASSFEGVTVVWVPCPAPMMGWDGGDVVCDVVCDGLWDPPSASTLPTATPMTTTVVPATILVRRTRARPSRRDCSAAPGSRRTMRREADAGTGADRTGPPGTSSSTIVSR